MLTTFDNCLPQGVIHTAEVGPTTFEKPEGVDLQILEDGPAEDDALRDAINERLEIQRSECAGGPDCVEIQPLTLTVAFYGDTSIPRTVTGELERIEWEAYMNPWSGRAHVSGADIFDFEVH